jgi:hypothetical protein
MKIYAIVIFALTSFFVSCGRQDTPAISVAQEEYLVDSNGGEITIPVTSTGIDDVVLNIEQNKSTFMREAIVQISSFSKTANVKVVQTGLSEQ